MLVKRRLGARVGFVCSNPDCQATTIGPATEATGTVNLGIAAHITAASPKGPRYDKNLSPRQRKSFENGIWLCHTCGKAVDADTSAHTVPQLRQWKMRAEQEARARLGVTRANSHFNLLPGDQTMYINVRRFQELARRSYIHVTESPLKPGMSLLTLGGSLAAFVMENERAPKKSVS